MMKNNLRNPVLAAILSAILPGTGQIYNQDIIKGSLIFIGFLFLAGTVLGGLAVWAFAIYDAWANGEKINRGLKKLRLERNVAFATVSSIICGWGQIYNGQALKGCLMLFCFIFLAPTGLGLIFMWVYSAIDALYTAKKINSGEVETPFIKGLIYQRLDDLHVLLESSLEEKRGDMTQRTSAPAEIKEKALLAMKRGDYSASLLHGKYALHSGGKNDPEIHRILGKSYINLGNYGFSALELIRALELGDRSDEVYNNLALSILNYSRSKNEEDFLYQGETCLKHIKDNSCWQSDINRINLLIVKGKPEEARIEAEQMRRKYPDLWQATHCLGTAYLERGLRQEAKEFFRSVLSKHPEVVESKIALARICEEEGAEEQALSLYEEILKLKPPERIVKGIMWRIKRLGSPDRKLLRMVLGSKKIHL